MTNKSALESVLARHDIAASSLGFRRRLSSLTQGLKTFSTQSLHGNMLQQCNSVGRDMSASHGGDEMLHHNSWSSQVKLLHTENA